MKPESKKLSMFVCFWPLCSRNPCFWPRCCISSPHVVQSPSTSAGGRVLVCFLVGKTRCVFCQWCIFLYGCKIRRDLNWIKRQTARVSLPLLIESALSHQLVSGGVSKHLRSNQVSQKTKTKPLRGKMSSLPQFVSKRLQQPFVLWWCDRNVLHLSPFRSGNHIRAEFFFFGELKLCLLLRDVPQDLFMPLKLSFRERPRHSVTYLVISSDFCLCSCTKSWNYSVSYNVFPVLTRQINLITRLITQS